MKKCPICKKSVNPDAKFCRNCGSSLLTPVVDTAIVPEFSDTKTCPLCGFSQNSGTAKFCRKCGGALSSAVVEIPNTNPLPIEVSPRKVLCRQCGNSLDPDAKFCNLCGCPTAEAAPAPADPYYCKISPVEPDEVLPISTPEEPEVISVEEPPEAQKIDGASFFRKCTDL